MERRALIAGLGLLATGPAFAQSAAPAPAEPAPAPAMKMAPPMNLSDVAERHLKETLAAGSLSLAVSRLALPKIKHPLVKQFAESEIAEQETIADILKGMQMPGATPTSTVKSPTDAEPAANLNAKGEATVEKIRASAEGAAFDRAFVSAQTEVHKTLLAIQEAYLKVPDSQDQTNLAKLARGMIREHLTLLGELEKAG